MTSVLNFYKFQRLDDGSLADLSAELLARCGAVIKGLIVIAPEGINATLAGPDEPVKDLQRWLTGTSLVAPIECKESSCERMPFRRLKIDRRPEIVTFSRPAPSAEQAADSFLSPAEWHARLNSAEPPIVLDVRNRYETALGKFRGAIDPEIDVFTELPDFIERAGLPRDREILTYCTGGIRCEKALGYLQEQGFQVKQLAGGILKYLEQFPNGAFEGECFVFDHRVAVDQQLNPSQRYKLCVHCGDPAELRLKCGYCGGQGAICESCNKDAARRSCSKNCAYHMDRIARAAG